MKKLQVWLPLLFALVMILGMRIGFKLRENVPSSATFFQSPKRSAVQEALDLIKREYVDPVNIDSLADDAIDAMLSHLDPHSVYIPAAYLREVNEDLQGNFEGIGVEFQIIDDTVNISNVLSGGPSDKAGLQVGDKFLKVEDSVVAGSHITSENIKKLLRGDGGSKVTVIILRGTKLQTATITRGTIPLYSVDAAYMIDTTTGFIHLNKFSSSTYEEFMQALEKLQKQGLKKLILDLRDNGGGILTEAVDIADEFLDEEKLIVYTQRGRQKNAEYRCKRKGLFEEGNLATLVNEGSASASEVLAGALQDWDRATILGRRTFGKGLVQEQYELSNGSALRLTVARYYTPTGRSIQKPYTEGREAYNEELLSRFNSGEVVRGDTVITHSGTRYKTKGGKTVYAGGGITPDIFVPLDTTIFSENVTALFHNQTFSRFIYTHYIENKQYFRQFKNPPDFVKRFQPTAETWDRLRNYAAKDSVDLSNLSVREKSEIERRMKTWMARQIWRMEGYYQVNNLFDDAVQKALEVVRGMGGK